MASTPEAKVKADVKKLLDELGIYHFSPVQNGMGASGVFDIVCCANGFFVGIECKKDPKTAPTDLQTQNAERAQECRGVVFLANGANMKELKALLTRIKEYTHGTVWDSFWPFERPAPFDKW